MKLEEMLKFALFLAATSMCIKTYPPESFLSSFSLSFFVFITSFVLLLLSSRKPTNSDEEFLKLLLKPRTFSFMANRFSKSTAARKLKKFGSRGFIVKVKIRGKICYLITEKGLEALDLPLLRKLFELLRIKLILLFLAKEGFSRKDLGLLFEQKALEILKSWLPPSYDVRPHDSPNDPVDIIITKKDGRKVFVEVKSAKEFDRALWSAKLAKRKAHIIIFFAREYGTETPFLLDGDSFTRLTREVLLDKVQRAFNDLS
ncbi:MAG: hypothetical protein DRO05_02700 [Thermoproteota archaeon]|nr:MAG: hypothetical protein DRO05_02700 [Candidatus Korarchaeota archaeon]